MSTPNTSVAVRPAQNVVSPGAHAIQQAVSISNKEAALLGSVIAPGLSSDELRAFAAICRHTGLDPFRKQIYAWKDKGRLTVHIAINGLRAQAARSGEYEGQVGPEWCGPDGVWKDVWFDETPPAACRVGVLRRGFANPIWSTVTWREFARTQSRTGAKGPTIWDEKGPHMLAIRAEGHSLQRAFPELFDKGIAEAAAVGASVAVADDTEMPQLPEHVDTETGEILDGESTAFTEPANAGEEPAETTQEEPPNNQKPQTSEPSPAELEAWYIGLRSDIEKAKLGIMDICPFLGTKNDAGEVWAAMAERGLDIPALIKAVKAAR